MRKAKANKTKMGSEKLNIKIKLNPNIDSESKITFKTMKFIRDTFNTMSAAEMQAIMLAKLYKPIM